MKFCPKCGNQLVDEAVICVNCGAPQETPKTTDANDKKSFGFALLGFIQPIIGLIIYLFMKDNTPLKAKSAGKGAIAGVIAMVLFFIVYAAFIYLVMINNPDITYEYSDGFQEFYTYIMI